MQRIEEKGGEKMSDGVKDEQEVTANKILSGVPQFSDSRRWHNSANVLCHYVKEQGFLDMILRNAAIIPRYVMEPLDYLGLKEIRKICFPMTCFCDIPLSKVSTHMTRYGEYGIGLDKIALLDKYRVQPIHYISPNSPLADDFKEAFQISLNGNFAGDEAILATYLLSTLMYMKPIWRSEETADGHCTSYVYQDECEWRYIPSDNFPKDLHLILKQRETTETAKKKYSNVLLKHDECWLKFEWTDLKYIIVPDEKASRSTISTIKMLDIKDDEKDMLVSKIEISRHFCDNM